MSKWDDRFLQLAATVASWSKDPSSKVGAVIVSPDRGMVIPGYNGFPRGIDDRESRFLDKSWKLSVILHAEMNAVLTAKQDLKGWHMYVTHHPCSNCSSVMVQAGIASVHYYTNQDFETRWADSLKIAREILSEGGLSIHPIDKPHNM